MRKQFRMIILVGIILASTGAMAIIYQEFEKPIIDSQIGTQTPNLDLSQIVSGVKDFGKTVNDNIKNPPPMP